MTAFLATIVKRHGAMALRALAVVGLATSLAGCYSQHVAQQEPPYPNDYHERHPITLKEREHTVEVFIGRNRGGLTPSQRADVLSFAQIWRRDSNSGIIVDVPRGGPTDRAVADSMREVRSILAASGVPDKAVSARAYRPSSPLARRHQAQLFQAGRRGRPVRPLAARSRPKLRCHLYGKPPILESRLRSPAQPRRHDRQSHRPGAAARRRTGLHRAPLGGDRQVSPG